MQKKKYNIKNLFWTNFAMMHNKPATARENIRVHMTVFLPTDGITCFDGTVGTYQFLMGLDWSTHEIKEKKWGR